MLYYVEAESNAFLNADRQIRAAPDLSFRLSFSSIADCRSGSRTYYHGLVDVGCLDVML